MDSWKGAQLTLKTWSVWLSNECCETCDACELFGRRGEKRRGNAGKMTHRCTRQLKGNPTRTGKKEKKCTQTIKQERKTKGQQANKPLWSSFCGCPTARTCDPRSQ
jgi:hypothetical protein